MSSFNKVIIMGNLTRDPEVKSTPSGAKVADIRMAVSENYRDKQTNELKQSTCFVDVVLWNRQAETAEKYLKKGSSILVDGRLQYDEWKNDKGETRSKLRVRAERFQFVGTARRDGEAPAQGTGYPAASEAAPEAIPPLPDDEDLPF